MLKTRGRKILRDVLTRKARTLLVASSIFVGVLGVVALFSMGEILLTSLEGAIDQNKLAITRTYITLRDPENLDNQAVIEAISQQPDVEAVEGLSHYPIFWKLPGEAEFDEGRMFAYSHPFEAMPLEPIDLVDGVFPTAGQHEIAVERRFADTHGVGIGDEITLRIVAGEPHEESWKIVGIVFEPYLYPLYAGSPNYIRGDEMIFVQRADMPLINGLAGYNLLLIRHHDFLTAKARNNELEAFIADQTPYVPITRVIEDPGKNTFIEGNRTFTNVLNLLALVALLVSGFLVFNVISSIVLEQRRQIGVMKSLGAAAGDNFAIYSGISLVYGLIGTIPGVILGVPLGFSMAQNLAPQFNIFVDEFTISWNAVILGIFLGLLVPLLASIYPVIMGTRVTILEAMTDLGIDTTFNRGVESRLLDLLPLPISIRQAFRNVIQKKWRLALTILTLSLAAGAFMGVYATIYSIDTVVKDIFQLFGYDMSFGTNEASDYEHIRDLAMTETKGIRLVQEGSILAVDLEGFTPVPTGGAPPLLLAFGFDPHNPDLMQFRFDSGTGWQDDPNREGIVISSNIARILHKKAGDKIMVNAGGSSQEFEIIGVAVYPFDAVWFKWQTLSQLGKLTGNAPTPNRYFTEVTLDDQPIPAAGINQQAAAFISLTDGEFLQTGQVMVSQPLADRADYQVGDSITVSIGDQSATYPISGIYRPQPNQPDETLVFYWEDLATLEGRSLEGAPIPNVFFVILDQEEATPAEVDEVIDEVNEVMLQNGVTASFTNWAENQEMITQLIFVIALVLNVGAVLIAAVGGIGLLSTLSMSVFERQKEIGVMRSIGATSGAVAVQFLIEGLLVGVLAWLIGIPISYVLNEALMNAFKMSEMPGAGYPLIAIGVGLIGTLGIAAVASLWPALAAARKTVSDILRYQ